jgi:hypothetical protein
VEVRLCFDNRVQHPQVDPLPLPRWGPPKTHSIQGAPVLPRPTRMSRRFERDSDETLYFAPSFNEAGVINQPANKYIKAGHYILIPSSKQQTIIRPGIKATGSPYNAFRSASGLLRLFLKGF